MEPRYKWQPVTDFYKEQQAAQTIDPEAETQQKLREIHEEAKKTGWVEKKAPRMVRVYLWYLLSLIGVNLLSMSIIGAAPQSNISTQLVASIGRGIPWFQDLKMEERNRQFLRERGINPDAMADSSVDADADQYSEESIHRRERQMVQFYLLVMSGLTGVIAFMWWNRSWRVRWFTMAYAGYRAVTAAILLVALSVTGFTSQLHASIVAGLVLGIGVNGCIFCYLAFWPGVEEWFNNG